MGKHSSNSKVKVMTTGLMGLGWKIAAWDDQNNTKQPFGPQSSAYYYLPGLGLCFVFAVATLEPPWCLPMELSVSPSPVAAAGAHFSFLY